MVKIKNLNGKAAKEMTHVVAKITQNPSPSTLSRLTSQKPA